MKLPLPLIVTFSLVALRGQVRCDGLTGCKWVFRSNDSTSDYIIFNEDRSYEDHENTEVKNVYFGQYVVSHDTVILYRQSAHDMHGFEKGIYKYLLRHHTLKIIYARYGQLSPKTQFDPNYIFRKERAARAVRKKFRNQKEF